jgi:hypothetical protein
VSAADVWWSEAVSLSAKPSSTKGMPSCRRTRDGKELYFLSPDGKMMAAEVKSARNSRLLCRSPFSMSPL